MEVRKKMEVKDRERARAMTLCGDSKFPGSHVWGVDPVLDRGTFCI